MIELINRFRDVYNTFWGKNQYQLFFYLGIVMICLFSKKKEVRLLFGLFPIVFLILLALPISEAILSVVAQGAWQYYARLFSILPVPYIIAIGFVILQVQICRKINRTGKAINLGCSRNRISNTAIKLIVILSTCILFIIGGTSIYKQDWMQSAENIDKAPNEALQICEALHEDDSVTIAVPSALSCYIRQIDPSFYMPYGRNLNELGEAISGTEFDPEYVMMEAGNEACDYIVTFKAAEIMDRFSEYGWEPYYDTKNYLVYKVENVRRIKKQYDRLHRIKKITIYDSEGNPTREYRGFCSYAYDYNDDNNTIKQFYLDENGKVMEFLPFSSIYSSYSKYSRQLISRYYCDFEDIPVLVNGRYVTRFEYDFDRVLVREKYYDAIGNLMDRLDKHYAIREIFHEESGKQEGEQFRDKYGNLVNCDNGYAKCIIDRDQADNIIKERYYDKNGVLLDEVKWGVPVRGNQFTFFHCTDGVTFSADHSLRFSKIYPNEVFIDVRFCLCDVKTDETIVEFGAGSTTGYVNDKYMHEIDSGIYYLKLVHGTSHAREEIKRLVYVEKGDRIDVAYRINDSNNDYTIIDNVSISVQ